VFTSVGKPVNLFDAQTCPKGSPLPVETSRSKRRAERHSSTLRGTVRLCGHRNFQVHGEAGSSRECHQRIETEIPDATPQQIFNEFNCLSARTRPKVASFRSQSAKLG
jgi:hypothetical protein